MAKEIERKSEEEEEERTKGEKGVAGGEIHRKWRDIREMGDIGGGEGTRRGRDMREKST